MSDVRYMISDAAKRLGIEAHVLRYWEEELDLKVPRTEMGHRYYTPEWIRVFEQVRELKQKGYQLRAIRMLIHNENPCLPEPVEQIGIKEMYELMREREEREEARFRKLDEALRSRQKKRWKEKGWFLRRKNVHEMRICQKET